MFNCITQSTFYSLKFLLMCSKIELAYRSIMKLDLGRFVNPQRCVRSMFLYFLPIYPNYLLLLESSSHLGNQYWNWYTDLMYCYCICVHYCIGGADKKKIGILSLSSCQYVFFFLIYIYRTWKEILVNVYVLNTHLVNILTLHN